MAGCLTTAKEPLVSHARECSTNAMLPPGFRQKGRFVLKGCKGRVTASVSCSEKARAGCIACWHLCAKEQRDRTRGRANPPAIGRALEGEIDCEAVWGQEGWWLDSLASRPNRLQIWGKMLREETRSGSSSTQVVVAGCADIKGNHAIMQKGCVTVDLTRRPRGGSRLRAGESILGAG